MSDSRCRAGALVCALLLSPAAMPARAADPEPARSAGPPEASGGAAMAVTYTVPRIDAPIKLDGLLDEQAWAGALALELPYEVEPGENIAAPVRTECFVAYDDSSLYVAFRAHDPDPASIRAHLSDRDGAERDDRVGFVIDTFNDERRGFQLFVNPLGVQMDASRNDVGNPDELGNESTEDPTWDAIWSSAAVITGGGYQVEMAIPFTSLRFPRSAGVQIWGFLPQRAYPRSLDHTIGLVPVDRNRSCTLCQAAKLTGFSGLDPGRNLAIIPTLTAEHSGERQPFPDGPLDQGGVVGSVGLTARWGVTPNLSLNGTLNPDFSQIEADAAQLTTNTRFALYYPEKRPFFMDGADFFTTPLNVIYTRTAVDPRWGIKLTGKEGDHALGAFVGRDERTTLIFPSNQESDDNTGDPSYERSNSVAGLRYRRDFGTSSTVGLLLTNRQGEGYHNRVYGADGVLRLSPVDTLRLQALRSDTLYPGDVAAGFAQPTGTLDGSALVLRYGHQARDWNWWGAYEDLGRDVRVDTGFIPRVDTRKQEAGIERTLWGKGGARYTRFLYGTWNWRIEDHDGVLTDQDLGLHIALWGARQSFLYARLARQKEFFEGVTYDKTAGEVSFTIHPTGDFALELRGEIGDAVDHDNGQPARILRLSPELYFNFGRRFVLEIEHDYETLHVAGGRLYMANLAQVRAVYQFTLRTFARAIVQYGDTLRSIDLYDPSADPADAVQPRTRELLTQVLFSYKVNPQTLVYVGYTDERSSEDVPGLDLTGRSRALFFKIGYAWVS